MNKNSNTYQILYAAVMVVLVGTALAFIYMSLKPRQDENIANDKRRQILSAVHVTVPEDSIRDAYKQYITAGMVVDQQGEPIDTTLEAAFAVDMSKENKLPADQRKRPVFVGTMTDGSTKYIIPVYGAGLWGPIWGYIALNDDGNTIYGANFSHQGETPGLGARITEDAFQQEFVDKRLYKNDQFLSVEIVKKGQKPTNDADYVDAISGATITSRGVGSMMHSGLELYDGFLKKLQNNNTNNQ